MSQYISTKSKCNALKKQVVDAKFIYNQKESGSVLKQKDLKHQTSATALRTNEKHYIEIARNCKEFLVMRKTRYSLSKPLNEYFAQSKSA